MELVTVLSEVTLCNEFFCINILYGRHEWVRAIETLLMYEAHGLPLMDYQLAEDLGSILLRWCIQIYSDVAMNSWRMMT